MHRFKKGLPLILILPLVVAGIFLSSCFCPSAQVSFIHQTVVQKSHDCCCSDSMQPIAPTIVGEIALHQPSFNQRAVTELFNSNRSSFPVILEPYFSKLLALSPLTGSPPQDIFLKNEVLRI